MLRNNNAIGCLVTLWLIGGCGSGREGSIGQDESAIVYRQKVDVDTIADAEEASVIIDISYDPSLPDARVIVCIPRPDRIPDEVKGSFSFSLYDNDTRLFSKNVESVVSHDSYETFFLFINAENLRGLKVYFAYDGPSDFRPVGDLSKFYAISFEQMANDLIQLEVDRNSVRGPGPPPMPSCESRK